MSLFSRKIRIFSALVIIVAAGYIAGSKLGFSANGVPAEFKDARFQGAIVAQDIVNLTNGVPTDLEKVNQLDEQKNYGEALNMTIDLLKRSQDVKNRAVELSAQLEKMTGALGSIKSDEARQAALDSISNRLALIGRLLSYSDYLTQLLNSLNKRFVGEKLPPNQIENLIAQINAEVTAINSFNREAGQAMDRFDNITRSSQ